VKLAVWALTKLEAEVRRPNHHFDLINHFQVMLPRLPKFLVLLLEKLLIGHGQIWLYFAQFLDTFRHKSVPDACRWIRIRMYTGLHLKRQSVFVLVGHDNFGGKDFAWIAGFDHTLEFVHYGPVDRHQRVLSRSQFVTTVRDPAWRTRRAEDCCRPTQ